MKSEYRTKKKQKKVALTASIIFHSVLIIIASTYVIIHNLDTPPKFISALKIGIDSIDENDKSVPLKMITRPKMDVDKKIDKEMEDFVVEVPLITDDIIQKTEPSDFGTITYEDVTEFEPIEMNNEIIEPQKASSGIDRNNQPEALFQPEPIHPEDLKRRGIKGKVTVRYNIDLDGKTKKVEILEASHYLFAKATVEAVRKWKFVPAVDEFGNRKVFTAQQIIYFNFRD